MSEIKDRINKIFDHCYSKDLSVCPHHTIFQRQKALHEILAIPEIRSLEKREGRLKRR